VVKDESVSAISREGREERLERGKKGRGKARGEKGGKTHLLMETAGKGENLVSKERRVLIGGKEGTRCKRSRNSSPTSSRSRTVPSSKLQRK
jgi:hypothetical protein